MYFLFVSILAHFLFGLLFLLTDRKYLHYLIGTFGSFVGFIGVLGVASGDSLFTEITEQIKIKPDQIGLVFAVLCSSLAILASIYAVSYMHQNNEKNIKSFLCFFHISIAIAIALAFSGNLITMFIFYELLTLMTYPLVTHSGNDSAKKAGAIYLAYLMIPSLTLLFPAILITFNIAGTTDFNAGLSKLLPSNYFRLILFLMFVYGIAKAAIMPLHKWLPSAMVAPTPVSALLHAVAVVKAGVFCIIKVMVYVFGTDNINNFLLSDALCYISGFTIVAASIIALQQRELKSILAYSTISQLSYIIMIASAMNDSGIRNALAYMVIHGFAKITLFFAVGAIYTVTKRKTVSEIKGIGANMPLTMTAFTIGAFAMIGLPPTAAFLEKYYIFNSAFDIKNYFMIAVLCISTVLNCLYFLSIILNAFFIKPDFKSGEASFGMYFPYLATSVAVIALTFFLHKF